MDKAREAALKIIFAVFERGGYANILLAEELKRRDLSELDRRFITELVYGVTKAGATLDWIIEHYVTRPVKKMEPWLKCILRLGIYQIFYLSRVPASAAVNEAVNLARRYGTRSPKNAGFVNAVLRSAAKEPQRAAIPANWTAKNLALREMHPEWLVQRWIDQFGYDAAEKICQHDNAPAPLTIRANTLKISRDELLEKLAAEGCTAAKSALAPEGIIVREHGALAEMPSLTGGLWQAQDESSMLVAHILDPQPDELILDVCSAPGGKTTHIAQLMKNRGKIIAADLYPERLKRVRENAARLGISIIETVAGDARQSERFLPADGRRFDRILVDAPCSGLGVLRRRPDARWRVRESSLKELPPLQLEILESAAQCLKDGGVLVYSTCTMAKAENRGVVKEFLRRHRDFSLAETGNFLPIKKRDEKYVQLLPHIDGTDGFFIARLERKG